MGWQFIAGQLSICCYPQSLIQIYICGLRSTRTPEYLHQQWKVYITEYILQILSLWTATMLWSSVDPSFYWDSVFLNIAANQIDLIVLYCIWAGTKICREVHLGICLVISALETHFNVWACVSGTVLVTKGNIMPSTGWTFLWTVSHGVRKEQWSCLASYIKIVYS